MAIGNVLDNSAKWEQAQNITDVKAGETVYADQLQVAISADGTKALAIWNIVYNNNWSSGIINSRSAVLSGSDLSWDSTFAPLTDGVNSSASRPRIALSDDGQTAVATWIERVKGTCCVNDVKSAVANISSNTPAWGTTTNISRIGVSNGQPFVATSAAGDRATIIWIDDTGTKCDTWQNTGQLKSASAIISGYTQTWGSSKLLASGCGDGGLEARGLGMSADGYVTSVAWSQSDGGNSTIYSKVAAAMLSGSEQSWSDPAQLGIDTVTGHYAMSRNGGRGIVSWGDWDGNISHRVLTITRPQSITFNTSLPPIFYGGTGTVSATGGDSGKPVVFTSKTEEVCSVSSSGTVTALAVGICKIAANQEGNNVYDPAAEATQDLDIGKASQAITFGTKPTLIYGGTGAVTATGGASGNSVVFTSNTTSVCTVLGTTVTAVTGGTCTIAANQEGNDNYNAAAEVTLDILINDVTKCDGFMAPVDKKPTVNKANAGRIIPLKWYCSKNGVPMTTLPADNKLTTQVCPSSVASAPADAIEEYAGSSGWINQGNGWW